MKPMSWLVKCLPPKSQKIEVIYASVLHSAFDSRITVTIQVVHDVLALAERVLMRFRVDHGIYFHWAHLGRL